ncbi:myelin regulatory factor-like protein [Erpetoichthys calabaricus]|uniref:myelin regulatory factor-like protein n=1 Tax=Erpetoichthys calabaricus TaxID=27687 RepID=UPI002233E7E9|nr:myelin regulatory factor-like protein [Erpetoichthys calabaricus]
MPMDVLGENEALQQFFEGHDVSGVLENPVLDTSVLEQYLSSDFDPASFLLPESPPDSSSDPCSPPQTTDVSCGTSWPPTAPLAPPFTPAINPIVTKGCSGEPPYRCVEFPGSSGATPLPMCGATSSCTVASAFPYAPMSATVSTGGPIPLPKKRKRCDSGESGINPSVSNSTSLCSATLGNAIYCGDGLGYESDGQNAQCGSGWYQSLTWSPYQSHQWTPLFDSSGNSLPTPGYQVDADKGFNYSLCDEAFVCQKKNHFQVTVHIGMMGNPMTLKTSKGFTPIDAFYINVFGIKADTPSHIVMIEQSQSDRSKKSFLPVKVNLPGDKITKVTLGRLHFSETTANNMRKKGKPNPDQRYFMLVVGLYAAHQDHKLLLTAHMSEKIIVRASNPGQFENDSDMLWHRGQTPDSVICHSRVGINTETPDEALVVCGNVKVMGTVMHPSDQRAKHNIQEVDNTEQLRRIAQMRIVEYDYKPEFASKMGIDQTHETGVIAQEVMELLPSAVKDVGEVTCTGGEKIGNFLMVDKEKIFMENVGAVKQLCKLTDNLETRIQELEIWNKHLAKLKRFGSMKSSMSEKIPSRKVSKGCPMPAPPQPTLIRAVKEKFKHCSQHKLFKATIITLVAIMAFCVITISALYMLSLVEDESTELGKLTTPDTLTTPVSTLPTGKTSTAPPEPWPPDISFCNIPPCEAAFCCNGSSSHFQRTRKTVRSDSQWTDPQLMRRERQEHSRNDQDWKNTTLETILIDESQQIIDFQYCMKQQCRAGNYTFVIPISKYIPPKTKVTLVMNSSEALIVYLCNYEGEQLCPGEKPRQTWEESPLYSLGYHHVWPLWVTISYRSMLHFRSAVPGRAHCATDRNWAGELFTDYYFHFYRRCP